MRSPEPNEPCGGRMLMTGESKGKENKVCQPQQHPPTTYPPLLLYTPHRCQHTHKNGEGKRCQDCAFKTALTFTAPTRWVDSTGQPPHWQEHGPLLFYNKGAVFTVKQHKYGGKTHTFHVQSAMCLLPVYGRGKLEYCMEFQGGVTENRLVRVFILFYRALSDLKLVFYFTGHSKSSNWSVTGRPNTKLGHSRSLARIGMIWWCLSDN